MCTEVTDQVEWGGVLCHEWSYPLQAISRNSELGNILAGFTFQIQKLTTN